MLPNKHAGLPFLKHAFRNPAIVFAIIFTVLTLSALAAGTETVLYSFPGGGSGANP